MNAAAATTLQGRAESAEVLYATEDPVIVSATDIDRLKQAALASPRQRARICTHANPAHRLHEMLIVLSRDGYVRPHKHPGKVESFTILEGEADVVLFADDGEVRTVIPMGSLNSGKSFYYRLSEPVFHTIVPRTGQLVVHEVTEGPFREGQTVFAGWSPDGTNAAAAAAYLASLPRN